uniref:Myelin expression factor 2 n=1 Tax=Paramormyrops kingsleyae TaxID=1676925 RepID=A0A3B3THV5_9TELE
KLKVVIMADVVQESEDKQEVLDTVAEQENESDADEVPKQKSDQKEKTGHRKSNRFHPYSKEKQAGSGDKKGVNRNRVFISNIPYDMKWQAIKDLMREKVGEVTYVELFKDAEGKSRVSDVDYFVVEFKDEEFVKKALDVMNRYDLSGRPLNIKEDPDGEHARRVLQRGAGMYSGGRGPEGGPYGMNLPPSIANNPNIPPEVIHSLQAGRLGSTVFVANLDFKVGWKKLKEVFSMAGVVKRADIKEDKDGKSRGMGTVTFDQPFEAVQAISMFNGQMLFDRPMHVKMDDKSLPPDDFRGMEKSPQLPRGLGGIGMGLGPGGQPLSASRIGGGGAGGGSSVRAAECFSFFGTFVYPVILSDMYPSAMGGMNRDFGRNDMSMSRGMGGGMGAYGSGMASAGGGPMGSGLGGGMDRMGSSFDRVGMDMNRGYGGYGTGTTHMGAVMSDRGSGSKAGCQIFVRNLSYDVTWQQLKEKFRHCGQVMFAEIKMENGRSKGCGTVRFDSPESAEQACRLMNGTKINGREVDVRIDRNA